MTSNSTSIFISNDVELEVFELADDGEAKKAELDCNMCVLDNRGLLEDLQDEIRKVTHRAYWTRPGSGLALDLCKVCADHFMK